MNTKHLVIACWSIYGIAAFAALIASAMLVLERSSSPEFGRGIGKLLAVAILVVVVLAGLLLYWLTRSRSTVGLAVVMVLIAWPVFVLISRPVKAGFNRWQEAREYARIGSFADKAANAMAEAILADDVGRLKELVGDKPLPAVRDRAGLDWVALSCVALAERGASVEPLRVVLEAGTDPKATRLPEGMQLLHFLILNRYRAPQALAAMELLLRHGIDPNQVIEETGSSALAIAGDDPEAVRLLLNHGAAIDQLGEYGATALVAFVGHRYWESALQLVERGAKLDLADRNGLSVDCYLKDWKDDVFGEHPEGLDRLRAAIAERRAAL